MTTFPPMAACIGVADRVMQKKRVTPEDDEDQDEDKMVTIALLSCLQRHRSYK